MEKVNKELIKILIFDLDGVITSEIKYWNTAKLTVWEIIESTHYLGLTQYFGEGDRLSTRLRDVDEIIISKNFIYELKRRAINSNWDLTFFVICLHLVSIFKELK
jgi:beta-phosphoglucomutase-like phosphatase (HAD superfamily)